EKAKRQCRYVFTIVGRAQKQAYNAFVRPRTVRRYMPRYHLFHRFRMISVHGRWPFGPSALDTIHVRKANTNDLDSLAEYLRRKKSARPLFYPLPTDFSESI